MNESTSEFADDPVTSAASIADHDADAARRMLDELVSRALAYHTSGELKALFKFTRRFPHLAPYNAMLLHVQNPGIQFALRAPVWERKYGRRVKPGSRPYVVLQTMGPVAFVFDVSDTEEMDPFSPPLPEAVTNPFPAKGQPPPTALPNLIKACGSIGIVIERRDYATALAGRVERIRGKPYDWFITLNQKHTPAQNLGTLAHEIGHVFCGHLGKTERGFWPDRLGLGHKVEEFEAEAVAYLVTDRMALDIGSDAYLADYLSKDQRLPGYSLETVLKAAGKVEEMAAGRFRPKHKKPETAANSPSEP
jgi:hypothetical protein